MAKKFIQIRGSGDIYEHTDVLASRPDIDFIEAGDDDTVETVAQALAKSRRLLAEPATIKLSAAESAPAPTPAPAPAPAAKKAAAVALPPGVTITEA